MNTSHSKTEYSPDAVRRSLIQKIAEDESLPALGSSVSRVIEMTSSGDEAVKELAHFILSDVALTQKILRLANTVCYKTMARNPVTTISKAIFLLGFDTVKTSALAMVLVDGLAKGHGQSVKAELTHALAASAIARKLARRSQFKDAEEAAIAALFKNVGHVMIAIFDQDLYKKMAAMVFNGTHTPTKAAVELLGCSLDVLSQSVLQEWQIPDAISHALCTLSAGTVKPAKNRQEWMQQVASFAAAAAPLVMGKCILDETQAEALLSRFGGALNLDRQNLGEILAGVADETAALKEQLTLSSGDGVQEGVGPAGDIDDAASGQSIPTELLLMLPEHEESPVPADRHPSGKPFNARELLLTGVQDVTEMMASGRCKSIEVVMLVLETLHSSLGFRFAAVCLKDVKTNTYRARICLGDNHQEVQSKFVFPVEGEGDLFRLALEKDADLVISDAQQPKIANLMPAWHRELLPDALSFIVLPLVVQKKHLGFFYADRALTAPEGVTPNEASLIKTLKMQVISGLNSR